MNGSRAGQMKSLNVLCNRSPMKLLFPRYHSNVKSAAYDWQVDVNSSDQGQECGKVECIQERNIDSVLPQVECAQIAEHTPLKRHQHTIQLRESISITDLVEKAVQEAFHTLKVELELKQSEALLELQRCVDQKCRDMHMKQARELQKLKADLTYRKQNCDFHIPLRTQVGDLETLDGDPPVPDQEAMELHKSGCHSLQIEPRVCPIANAEDRLGQTIESICEQEVEHDDTWQRCEYEPK